MPAALAEPQIHPSHSPHGEQDAAVMTPEVDTEETQAVEQESSIPSQGSDLSVEPTASTSEPVAAAAPVMEPMSAAAPVLAPMEGNATVAAAEKEETEADEATPGSKEVTSGEGDAPPSGEDGEGGASPPSDAGSSGDNTENSAPASAQATEGVQEDTAAKEEEEVAPATDQVEPTAPRSPEEDPDFQATVSRTESTATAQQAHENPTASAGAAQASAISPANERESMAEAGQVDEMEQQEPGVFNAAAFKSMLMDAIKAILPKDEDEADDFADSGKMDKVKNKASNQVESEKQSAAGNIEQKTQETPDTSQVPEKEVKPLEPQDPGQAPKDIEASKAMPDKRGDAEVTAPLQQNMSEVDQKMADAEVTDEQLEKSNEPSFTGALGAKSEAKKHTEEAPGQFRQQEQQTLSAGEANAQAAGESQLTAMHQDRAGLLAQVSGEQQNTAKQDTSARQKVADHINELYEQTKTAVENILTSLDSTVKTMFDGAANRATKAFENLVERRMDAYKEKRYGGVSGFFRRVGDVFTGLPDEVNAFFTEGRNLYIKMMDGELTTIAEYVAEQLNAAKERIQKGKQDIQDYVVSLPQELQQVGKDAADAVQEKFSQLEESVNSKQEELVDSLAEQYKESLDKVDARIEEMKAANRGLIDMALGAIMGVIEVIIKIKNLLFGLLSAALEAIGSIISDPIGFLSNLISGIKQGIQNFFGNILNNVMTGLIEWLTGSLGNVGIQIPDNLFSLSGIFSLVTQMLGLTWDYFRDKAVKLLGEPMVNAMETGFELFQIIRKDGVAGLWEHIKEQFSDLKEMVMDAIRDMIITKVIEAGIKWILGLMSPAGAFVKAAMMIIDIVKFFIERAAQIFDLVQAFIDGIRALASGNVSAVAKAIEKALVKAIPVLIGFLAALVGITGLTGKIQKIVKKVRKRIDKAIMKIIKKAKRLFGGKKKGKKVTNKELKEDKTDKAAKLEPETFKMAGKKHTLTFEGNKVMMASVKGDLLAKLDKAKKEVEANPDAENLKGKGQHVIASIGGLTKAVINTTSSLKSAQNSRDDKKMAKAQTSLDRLGTNIGKFGTKYGLKDLTDIVTEGKGDKVAATVLHTGSVKSYGEAKIAEKREGKQIKGYKAITKKGSQKADGITVASPAGNKYSKKREEEKDFKEHFDKLYPLSPAERRKQIDKVEKHSKYKPTSIGWVAEGGKLKVSYKYTFEENGKNKTNEVETYLSVDGKDIVHDTLGKNLAIKEPSTYGNTDSVDNAKANESVEGQKKAGVGEIKFNASHILADWFQGSGYKDTLNLVTASKEYNTGEMLDAERIIHDSIEDLEKRQKRTDPNAFITFNLRVTARYREIKDAGIVEKLKKVKDQETANSAYELLKKHQDPVLVQEVLYNVEAVYLNGSKSDPVDFDIIEAEALEDKHLKEKLKAQ